MLAVHYVIIFACLIFVFLWKSRALFFAFGAVALQGAPKGVFVCPILFLHIEGKNVEKRRICFKIRGGRFAFLWGSMCKKRIGRIVGHVCLWHMWCRCM